MREILFRGKRIDNGEWVYGFYVKATHHWHKNGVHDDWIVCSAFANGGWFNVVERHAVDPTTVGQYTGLTDTTGRKIFEGDIVVNAFERALTYSQREVAYRDGKFAYVSEIIGYEPRPVRIVGNIHDRNEKKGGQHGKEE